MFDLQLKSQNVCFIVFRYFALLYGYNCYQFFHAENFSCESAMFVGIFDMDYFTANGLMVDDCVGKNIERF